MKEVGGPSFFALLVIAVSFLPVLTLEAQEGRLFKPLAYTKNFAMIVAAVLAITLDPALRMLFFRKDKFRIRPRWIGGIVNAILVGTIHSEEKHPISRVLMRAVPSGGGLEAALEVGRHRRRRRHGGCSPCRSTSGWVRNSCRRSMRARCCSCRARCPASPWRKRSS